MRRDLVAVLAITAFILGILVGRWVYEPDYFEIYDCDADNLPLDVKLECDNRPKSYV